MYTYKNRIHHSVGEVTTGIGIYPKIAAARSWRHDKMVSRLCREGAAYTIRWSAGCVVKVQPNAIDMPCDTKA